MESKTLFKKKFNYITLIEDELMQNDWYKDPFVSCIFSTIQESIFLFYPRSNYSIRGVELFLEDQTIKIKDYEILFEVFSNSITFIKHYFLNQIDFLFGACENNLFVWKFIENKWELILNIQTNGGFIYTCIVIQENLEKNIIGIGSFTNNFPIKFFDFEGILQFNIDYKEKTFFLDKFNIGNEIFIVIASWNSDFSIYNLSHKYFVYEIKLKGNLKNLLIRKNLEENYLFTILDWRGSLYEIDHNKNSIIKTINSFACTSPALSRFDSNVVILNGKKKDILFIDIDNWEVLNKIDNIHNSKLIVNIWTFSFPNFGKVLLTYGFDKTIKLIHC